MTAGGNLAWAAANIGGPGTLSHLFEYLSICSMGSLTYLAGSASLREIDRMVMFERPGSGGLLYLPYLNGKSKTTLVLWKTRCFVSL